MAYVLLIEDEPDLVRSLTWRLQRAGHEVSSSQTGTGGLTLARERAPDLILLDVMLPDLGGVAVCRTLRSERATQDVPIIMLTACGEEIDRVVAFEVGADDYVVKPFSPRELLLRIDAVLRRAEPAPAASVLTAGELRLETEAHRVQLGKDDVELSPMEFQLLRVLMSNPGRLLSREDLVRQVWNRSVAERTVDTSVKRLRRKLEREGDRIETLRGAGYRFRS